MSKQLQEQDLLGLDITEARKKLGEWYTLENQSVVGTGNTYTFHRAPNKKVHIITDEKNIVIFASGNGLGLVAYDPSFDTNLSLQNMHAVSDEEIYGDILIDNDPYFYEYNSVNKEVCIYNYNDMGNVEGVAYFEDEALVKQVCELIEKEATYYLEHSYDGITHFEKDGVDYSVTLKAPYIIISSSEPEFEIDGNEVQEKEFKFSSDIEALSIYNHIADSHFIGHTEQEFIDENDIAVGFDDDER